MGRTLTLRGVVPRTTRERVFFFDSNITNTGWKIKDVRIQNQTIGRYEVDAVLHTTDRTITILDWDRNTVVACLKSTVNIGNTDQNLIDKDHVIVSNLYLSNLDDTYTINYLIILEEMSITPSENVMYQLKEVAQNVDNP
tara:strand:- start:202 stop:621 length:420 start_codon:yes stop_codon:yes gene_type:complete